MFDIEQQGWASGCVFVEERVPHVTHAAPSHPTIVQPGFQLPPSVWGIMVGCYSVFFLAMAGLAGASGAGLFMVIVSALYTTLYFTTGCLLARLPGRDDASPLDQGKPLPTWCGPMDRRAVYGQVLIVPVGIAIFGVAAMLISRLA